jgi:lysophospholipase L1-like esterase
VPKPEGTTRVLFLGDSCTALGEPKNYPMFVENLLRERDAERRYEVVNLSLPGYSSHQGRVLARRFAQTIEADVVLVYYGWNDHWQAYGEIDSEKHVSPRAEGLAATMDDMRLLQLVRWALASLGPQGEALEEVRVPPDDYRANLRSIVEDFRAVGTPVVLVTAPSTFRRLGVSQFLVTLGFLPDRPSGLERHDAYVAMTREAAELEGAQLFDLAGRFDHVEYSPPIQAQDGIHFTKQGRFHMGMVMAEHVAEVLAAR